MNTRNIGLVCFTVFMCLRISDFAYDVTGSNLTEIFNQSPYLPYGAKAYWQLGGTGYTGTTTPKPKQTTGQCLYVSEASTSNVDIKLDSWTDIPNWTNEAQAPCSSIKVEWDRFVSCANVHEQGHIDIVNDFTTNSLPGYITQIKALKTTGTGDTQKAADDDAKSKLANEVDKITDEILSKIQTPSDKYDKDTKHGETQGATLNCGIVCSTPTPPPARTP